jgi:hypothetical protein
MKAKDLIDDRNVVRTYQENKYICFIIKNGIRIKLDPNEVSGRGEANKKEGKK